jgi:hypothetical protein
LTATQGQGRPRRHHAQRLDVAGRQPESVGSKSHLWVNWLGDILEKRDDDKKDRLLFTNMIAEHPGAGTLPAAAVPGGTFVLCLRRQPASSSAT